MVDALEWHLNKEFRRTELKPWAVNGTSKSGIVKSAGGLTFLTVEGAGHIVSLVLFLCC